MSQPNAQRKNANASPAVTPFPLRGRICNGFDRLWMYIDLPEVPEAVVQLIGDSGTIRSKSPKMAPHLQTQILLFQPSTELLVAIDAALRGRAEIMINYVEVAVDYLPPPSIKTAEVVAAVLASMHPLKGQHPVRLERHGTNYYFEPRHLEPAEKKRRRPCVRVMYADKPSKLAAASDWGPSPCLHIESRLYGKDTLERAGIFTLRDLIEFDHAAFWRSEMVFVRRVNLTEIGKWLRGSKMTRTSWIRTGKYWTSKHRVNGMFCLHNAWITWGVGRVFGEFKRFACIEEFLSDFERKALQKTRPTGRRSGVH